MREDFEVECPRCEAYVGQPCCDEHHVDMLQSHPERRALVYQRQRRVLEVALNQAVPCPTCHVPAHVACVGVSGASMGVVVHLGRRIQALCQLQQSDGQD